MDLNVITIKLLSLFRMSSTNKNPQWWWKLRHLLITDLTLTLKLLVVVKRVGLDQTVEVRFSAYTKTLNYIRCSRICFCFSDKKTWHLRQRYCIILFEYQHFQKPNYLSAKRSFFLKKKNLNTWKNVKNVLKDTKRFTILVINWM